MNDSQTVERCNCQFTGVAQILHLVTGTTWQRLVSLLMLVVEGGREEQLIRRRGCWGLSLRLCPQRRSAKRPVNLFTWFFLCHLDIDPLSYPRAKVSWRTVLECPALSPGWRIAASLLRERVPWYKVIGSAFHVRNSEHPSQALAWIPLSTAVLCPDNCTGAVACSQLFQRTSRSSSRS